MPEIIK